MALNSLNARMMNSAKGNLPFMPPPIPPTALPPVPAKPVPFADAGVAAMNAWWAAVARRDRTRD
jgi:hypothetical protein